MMVSSARPRAPSRACPTWSSKRGGRSRVNPTSAAGTQAWLQLTKELGSRFRGNERRQDGDEPITAHQPVRAGTRAGGFARSGQPENPHHGGDRYGLPLLAEMGDVAALPQGAGQEPALSFS